MIHTWWLQNPLVLLNAKVEYFRIATQKQERRTCNTGISELN